MKCIHCKRTIEDDSEFCVYCGSKVTPYDNSIFEEKKKNKVSKEEAHYMEACFCHG